MGTLVHSISASSVLADLGSETSKALWKRQEEG